MIKSKFCPKCGDCLIKIEGKTAYTNMKELEEAIGYGVIISCRKCEYTYKIVESNSEGKK